MLKGHEEAVNGVACFVGADGKPRIVSVFDKTVRVWDPSSGEEEAVLEGHGVTEWRGVLRGCGWEAAHHERV